MVAFLGDMRAVMYRRVSTGKQVESGLSLEDQGNRVEAEVASRGWEHTASYTDAGRSGRNLARRLQLRAALGVLAAGEADALVVAKLDRLARSTIDLAEIIRRSETQGWALVILDLDLDTSTPAGKMAVTMMGA